MKAQEHEKEGDTSSNLGTGTDSVLAYFGESVSENFHHDKTVTKSGKVSGAPEQATETETSKGPDKLSDTSTAAESISMASNDKEGSVKRATEVVEIEAQEHEPSGSGLLKGKGTDPVWDADEEKKEQIDMQPRLSGGASCSKAALEKR